MEYILCMEFKHNFRIKLEEVIVKLLPSLPSRANLKIFGTE